MNQRNQPPRPPQYQPSGQNRNDPRQPDVGNERQMPQARTPQAPLPKERAPAPQPRAHERQVEQPQDRAPERQSAQSRPQERAAQDKQTNICVMFNEYNNGVIYGTVATPAHLMGQEVGVRLQEAGEMPWANPDFVANRLHLDEMAHGYHGQHGKVPGLEIGNHVMMRGCLPAGADSHNTPLFKAQFGEVYGRTPDHSVTYGEARIRLPQKGFQTGTLDVLHTDMAMKVTDLRQVEDFYHDHMRSERGGVSIQPSALVRVIPLDGGAKAAWSVWAYPSTEPSNINGKNVSLLSKPEHSFEDAFLTGRQGNGELLVVAAALDPSLSRTLSGDALAAANRLHDDLKAGKVGIEIIPAQQYPIVGKTLDNFYRESALSRTLEKTMIQVGREKYAPGFMPMTIGLLQRASNFRELPDNLILTKITPDEFAKAKSPGYVATPNFTPEHTRDLQRTSDQRAEQAAQRGGAQVPFDAQDRRQEGQQREQRQQPGYDR